MCIASYCVFEPSFPASGPLKHTVLQAGKHAMVRSLRKWAAAAVVGELEPLAHMMSTAPVHCDRAAAGPPWHRAERGAATKQAHGMWQDPLCGSFNARNKGKSMDTDIFVFLAPAAGCCGTTWAWSSRAARRRLGTTWSASWTTLCSSACSSATTSYQVRFSRDCPWSASLRDDILFREGVFTTGDVDRTPAWYRTSTNLV